MLNRTYLTAFSMCLMLVAATCPTYADVQVHVSVPAAESAYTQGDIIAVEIELAPDGGPVAGVQLEIACESDAVRIQDVDFSQAFTLVLGQEPAVLPAQQFRTVRVSAIGGSVPSVSSPVLIATIKVEVMSDGPFTTHVQITAVASTIGRQKTGTVVQSESPADFIPNGLRLRIDNNPVQEVESIQLGQSESSSETVLVTSDDLDIEILPASGGNPVTTLAAHEGYELHYDADDVQPNAYAIYVVGGSNDPVLLTADAPDAGAWAAAETTDSALTPAEQPRPTAPDYAAGLTRVQSLAGNLSANATTFAASSGHLLSFSPDGAGTLRLHVFLWRIDPLLGEITELSKQIELTVE